MKQSPTIPELCENMLHNIRTVFCHPDDIQSLRNDILSKDINLIGSNWLERNHYIATKDVIVKTHIKTGSANQDFINNEMTVYLYRTFE